MAKRKKRGLNRQGKLLAQLHNWKYKGMSWLPWYPERERDQKKLLKLGLIRLRRRGSSAQKRTWPWITTKGEDALYNESLGIPKPMPKSRRKEKRSRHV